MLHGSIAGDVSTKRRAQRHAGSKANCVMSFTLMVLIGLYHNDSS